VAAGGVATIDVMIVLAMTAQSAVIACGAMVRSSRTSATRHG